MYDGNGNSALEPSSRYIVTEPPQGGGSSTRISLSDSQRSKNTNTNTQSIQYHILSLSMIIAH
jgi:hypothetical protein